MSNFSSKKDDLVCPTKKSFFKQMDFFWKMHQGRKYDYDLTVTSDLLISRWKLKPKTFPLEPERAILMIFQTFKLKVCDLTWCQRESLFVTEFKNLDSFIIWICCHILAIYLKKSVNHSWVELSCKEAFELWSFHGQKITF